MTTVRFPLPHGGHVKTSHGHDNASRLVPQSVSTFILAGVAEGNGGARELASGSGRRLVVQADQTVDTMRGSIERIASSICGNSGENAVSIQRGNAALAAPPAHTEP